MRAGGAGGGRLGAGVVAVAALAGALGCGAPFELPTEQPGGALIPSDGSYQMIGTWHDMNGIQDVLLTSGGGSQLFLLFNTGGAGLAPRGRVVEYARLEQRPIAVGTFEGLFNPVALAAGADPAVRPPRRIFVLDQGDTCRARENPQSGTCDRAGGFDLRITHLERYWRVREFDLTGRTAYPGFTDTSLAFVWGIAADDRGHVYVAGKAIVLLPNPHDPRLSDRVFQDRIYRYRRGPLPGGGADRNLPGSDWHRDRSFEIQQGTGVGTVNEPRGMSWSAVSGPALFVADFGKNWVQKMPDGNEDLGGANYYRAGDLADPQSLLGPTDVSADGQGYFYVVDEGNRRVLRYSDAQRTFVQRVDVEPNDQRQPLMRPVAVAADLDRVYVADRDAGQVVRYLRRP